MSHPASLSFGSGGWIQTNDLRVVGMKDFRLFFNIFKLFFFAKHRFFNTINFH